MGDSGWENPGPARQVIIVGPTSNPAVLAYSPIRAADDLVFALSVRDSADIYGNRYYQGLTLAGNNASFPGILFPVKGTSISGPSGLKVVGTSAPDDLTQLQLLSSELQLVSTGANPDMWLWAANGGVIHFGGFPGSPQTQDIQFGTGLAGRITSRDSTYSKSVPNNTVTLITSLTTVLQESDYGGEWSAGVFTAPVAGFYDTSHYANSPGGLTDFRCTIRLDGVNIAEDQTDGASVDVSCSYTGLAMGAGQQLQAVLLQQNGTAVNKTITGRFSVCRRLG